MSGPWTNYQSTGAEDAGPWAKYGGETTPPEPGFLDKEIPLTSHMAATESGLQSIGRGFRGIGQAIMHPIDTVKGMADLPSQAAQVPAAIHDINQSADPLGTYAKVGQETAGQGAAQALTAAGTEGLAKGAAAGARAAKPLVGPVLRTAGNIIDPEISGMFSPRLAHIQRVAGRVGEAMRPKPVFPGAHLPEAPPTYPGAPLPEHPGIFPGAPLPENPGTFPGAHLPEHPGTFPGAPLPEAPPAEVFQARPIAQGASPTPPPIASSLGKVPVRPLPEVKAPLPTEPVGPFREKISPIRSASSTDAAETKGIQEQMREAGEREDRARLGPENRAKALPTKGELIKEANTARGVATPEKPVKLTTTPKAKAISAADVPAGSDSLLEKLQTMQAEVERLKKQAASH